MEPVILKDIGIFLGGLVAASLGYFLKRLIERRSDHESLELNERALRVNRELKDQNLAAEDLHKLQHLC